MTAKRLRDFLARERVRYETIPHPAAYTARDTAEAAHIRTKDFAKTVIVKIDDRLAMAVLRGSEKLDLSLLKKAVGAKNVHLAAESELERSFPGCEPGAMPPFGNLYGMEVFVSRSLSGDEHIAFNAGSHAELVKVAYADFERLVQPVVATLTAAPRVAGKERAPEPVGGAGTKG